MRCDETMRDDDDMRDDDMIRFSTLYKISASYMFHVGGFLIYQTLDIRNYTVFLFYYKDIIPNPRNLLLQSSPQNEVPSKTKKDLRISVLTVFLSPGRTATPITEHISLLPLSTRGKGYLSCAIRRLVVVLKQLNIIFPTARV